MTVRNSALSSSKLRANGAIYYVEAFPVEKYIVIQRHARKGEKLSYHCFLL